MEKSIIRIYKPEELKQMNLMFDKEKDNFIFSKEELEFANQFDLFDKNVGMTAKIIWKYKNDKETLNNIQEMLERNENCYNIVGGVSRCI